jgi:hypothetical protein
VTHPWVGQVLAWTSLLAVASTSAYGLQLTAAAMVPTAAAEQRTGSSLSARDADEIRARDRAQVQAASAASATTVLIIGEDAATGDHIQIECATSNSLASDMLLVDLKDLADFAAHICN